MRTYEEILNDVIDHHFKNVSHKPVDLRKEVAKEYAKMWVERAALKANHTTSQDILKLKNEIDAQ